MVTPNDELMRFFKTFVDVDRLKIVGVLAKGQVTIPELAESLGMSTSETLHHIKHLTDTGLVLPQIKADGQEVYILETKLLEEMAKRQFARAREMEPVIQDRRKIPADFSEEDRKIILHFTRPNGEVIRISYQQKKQQVIIRYVRHHLLQSLEPGKKYTEKEISLLIKQLHPDAAFFRRNFVDTGYLDRLPDGSAYWLTEKGMEEVHHE